MPGTISYYKKQIQFKKGERARIEDEVFELRSDTRKLKKDLEYAEEARRIIQYVANKTQKRIEYSISELTSTALATVFNNPYKFICRFKNFGSKNTHCDFLFERDGYEIKPNESSSGGACNIAALGLMCTMYVLAVPKTRPILFIEEPFLELKGKSANIKGLKLINLLSKKLGIQFIIISDERVKRKYIKKYSNKLFISTMDENNISKITEI